MFRADAAGCAGSTWGLCYSALARRRAVPLHRIVNCVPARCCVWPDIGRHRRLVRAGVWRRGAAVLSRRFAFGSRLPCVSVGRSCVWFTTAVRFCWKVLRLVHDCRAFLLECLRSITPVSFPLSGKERRLAISCVSIPRGSGSPLERSRSPCGYRTCSVHFGLERFFAAIPTELREDGGTRGYGVGGAA